MENMKMDNPSVAHAWMSKQQHDTYPFINPSKSNFSGRAVLISGASKGVGRAMAISYAKAGTSDIAILARSDLSAVVEEVEQAASEAGRNKPRVLPIKCDITSVDDCTNAAKKVEEVFGRLDILINNAGYLETWKNIVDSDPDDWWRTFEVNVKGVYLMCRAFIPLVLKSSQKTIITTTSGGALSVKAGASAYQTTKQTQLRLTDFLVAEYGSYGLLAYSIHPGGIKTELASGMPEDMHAILIDEPELPGDTVVWLTRERREWLADRYVSCTWDMEELIGRRREVEDGNLLRMRLRV